MDEYIADIHIIPVVELTHYYACCYCDGPLADTDTQQQHYHATLVQHIHIGGNIIGK